jgi:starch synthase
MSGKFQCKLDLLRHFGLPDDRPEVPVIGVVSRMAGQKGFDLIEQVAGDLVNWDIRMVVLGTGEARYEALFGDLAAARPDRFAVHLGFDGKLAHRIEAGSDIFLMPSHYEPCGLNQMYSLRYGTVPIVHNTGGLADTVDSETGFRFAPYSAEAMLGALRAALTCYWVDRERWLHLMRTGMRRDFSWETAAVAYRDLYHRLVG